MSGPSHEVLESRLLVVAPLGKDASLMAQMLRRHGIAVEVCPSVAALAAELERGAAAVLVTEEALLEGDEPLARCVARQQPWSDIPVLLLTRQGADSAGVQRALERLGNVTLLERPLVVASLLSAARTALRARERQYQTRAYLAERDRADQRKDEFLATLAHELRNPLAPIRNSVNILRLARGAEPPAELYDMMERQVDLMVRLVDDLLEVSRITRGKIELRLEPADLADVIGAALETSRPLAEAMGHQLSVSVPAGLLVEADPVRLAQVFSNLLNNAVKYTEPHGRIDVQASREGERAEVRISDTGIGIAPDWLPYVFDMFMQVEAPDGRPQSGLGIGLTLARSLVEMHRGSIVACSDGPGKGSCFIVTLPLAAGAGAALERPESHPGGRLPATLPRVLVVDDNRDAAETLAALLRLLGAEVRVAHDGHAALREADAYRPGLMFLDIGMPEMDGYEVARRVRSRPELRNTVIVALTGWGQERDRQLSQKAGFNHHLVKPVDLDAMQAVLEAAAGR